MGKLTKKKMLENKRVDMLENMFLLNLEGHFGKVVNAKENLNTNLRLTLNYLDIDDSEVNAQLYVYLKYISENGLWISLKDVDKKAIYEKEIFDYVFKIISDKGLSEFETNTLIELFKMHFSNYMPTFNYNLEVSSISEKGRINFTKKSTFNPEAVNSAVEKAFEILNEEYSPKGIYYTKSPELSLGEVFIGLTLEVNADMPEKCKLTKKTYDKLLLPAYAQEGFKKYIDANLVINLPEFVQIDPEFGFVIKVWNKEFLITEHIVVNRTDNNLVEITSHARIKFRIEGILSLIEKVEEIKYPDKLTLSTGLNNLFYYIIDKREDIEFKPFDVLNEKYCERYC